MNTMVAGRASAILLTVLAASLTGCGGGSAHSSSDSPTTRQTQSSSPGPSESTGNGYAGSWTGTFASRKFDGLTGGFTLIFTETGSELQGTATIDSSCVPTGSVSGKVSGSTISFGAVKGAETVLFEGNKNGDQMSGDDSSGPSCGDDNGTWVATKQ